MIRDQKYSGAEVSLLSGLSFTGSRESNEDHTPVDEVGQQEGQWEDNSAVLICPEHKCHG